MPTKEKPIEERAFGIADELISWWACAAYDITLNLDPEPDINGDDLPRECMADRVYCDPDYFSDSMGDRLSDETHHNPELRWAVVECMKNHSNCPTMPDKVWDRLKGLSRADKIVLHQTAPRKGS